MKKRYFDIGGPLSALTAQQPDSSLSNYFSPDLYSTPDQLRFRPAPTKPDFGTYANAAMTGLDALGGMITGLEGKKYKDQANSYQAQMQNNALQGINQINSLNTNQSLLSGFSNYKDVNAPQFAKKSAGSTIGQSAMAIGKGALAGSQIMPGIGTVIGGAITGLADAIGQIGAGKQRRKANAKMNLASDKRNSLLETSLYNQAGTVDSLNDRRAMANYAELGGYIPTMSGALDYDLANKQLAINNLFAVNQGKMATNKFADGGSIHIDPKNRGKFNATKARTGKTTEELTHSNNPLTRKRAIFAQNAAKWNHHEDGGNLFAIIPNQFQHGSVFQNALEYINSGGTHDSNPLGGVPMGIDQEGVPNLVEEGEVKWNDYIFSNTLKLDEVGAKNNTIANKYIGKTFADIAKDFNTEGSERPHDPVFNATLDDFLNRLMSAQEAERTVKDIAETNEFAGGGLLNNWMQAAPIIGSGLATLGDTFGLTNNNDYTHINAINDPAPTPLISPERIGNYMSYVPLDRDYYTNRQAAQTAATRSAISNASNGNRGALMNTLLAADMGGNMAEGALARQAQEADLNQQLQIANFNRGTNMFNSQQELQAAAQNSDVYRYDAETKARMELNKAQMKQAIDIRDRAERDANLSNFYNNLGSLGRERIAMNSIMNNPGLYYYWDKDGSIRYKDGYENLTPEQRAIIDADSERTKPSNSRKCGGRLTIKSK